MGFAEKIWLLALLPALPAAAALFFFAERSKRRQLSHFASSKLLADLATSASAYKRNIKAALFVLAVGLLILALARPQWGYEWQETKGKGIDILIALDTSKSMLAEDILPNRLERSKLAILDLVERIEGDRIGLIAFAGSAFLECPLTLDYDAFRLTLEAFDTNLIPRGGTNIASAIAEAEATFSDENNFKILVLITDGEDLEASGITQAKAAAEKGVKIYTVGVGSPAGELIPIRDANGGVDFLKDEDGNLVKTRLDESTLTAIAEATDGFYASLGTTGQGLEQVYAQGLATIPKEEREARLQQVPKEQFQWPLGLAILALFAEGLLGTRRRNVSRSPLPLRWAAIFILVALIFAQSVGASPRKAEKLYLEGSFEEAGELYEEAATEEPEDSRLHFNVGASRYRTSEYKAAADTLERATKTDDLELQSNAYYNLGNTRYRMGEDVIAQDPQRTVEHWEQALTDYENALNINPGDADAQYNYDLVKKRLEQLKEHMQQQQQQQDQQNQEQNQDQEQQQDQQQQQQDQQQEQNEQSQQDQRQEQQQSGEEQEQEESQHQQQQEESGKEEEQEPQPQNQQGEEQDQEPQEEQQAQQQVIPGRMTREEARQLLEAMKDDERKLPIGILEKVDPQQGNARGKDW